MKRRRRHEHSEGLAVTLADAGLPGRDPDEERYRVRQAKERRAARQTDVR